METENEALHPQFRQPDVSGSINLSEGVEIVFAIKNGMVTSPFIIN